MLPINILDCIPEIDWSLAFLWSYFALLCICVGSYWGNHRGEEKKWDEWRKGWQFQGKPEEDKDKHLLMFIKVRISTGGLVSPEHEDSYQPWAVTRSIVRFIARVVLPIFTVVFVIGYIIYSVYSYANPTLTF
jgi:hypothetical protein